MKYDLIIVLGSHPDQKTWKFPTHIYDCLDLAANKLEKGDAPFIVTCGNLTIDFENSGIKQPFKECNEMAKYLEHVGVPKSKILKEDNSKDTISNLYYLKTDFFLPQKMNRLLFIVADFRIPRLKFLCKRILGSKYNIDFEAVPGTPSLQMNERKTFNKQRDFLRPMKDGDHSWLADKFYTAAIYKKS